jgi:membrane protease subunit HflK
LEKKHGKLILISVIVVLLGLWSLSGVYTISDTGGEEAVVVRFGKYIRTEVNSGLHWHLPSPIEGIHKENVQELRTIEIGLRTQNVPTSTRTGSYSSNIKESEMLTKEEAILQVSVSIKYKIDNIYNFVFKVDDQEGTLKLISESVVRRVIASHELDETIATNKSEIQEEIHTDLQEVCNLYQIGVVIEQVKLQDVEAPDEVKEAFKSVTNAKASRDSIINVANAYKTKVILDADGNAKELVNNAEAYKKKKVIEASGEADRFKLILAEYDNAKDVTKIRLYIEMLEEVLPDMKKFIVENDDGVVKFLPLEETNSKIIPTTQEGGSANE